MGVAVNQGVSAEILTSISTPDRVESRLGTLQFDDAAPPKETAAPLYATDIYFGPVAPEGKEHNWLQTVPGKGWWTILRLYNPLQPFFDKTWRPSEIEAVD